MCTMLPDMVAGVLACSGLHPVGSACRPQISMRLCLLRHQGWSGGTTEARCPLCRSLRSSSTLRSTRIGVRVSCPLQVLNWCLLARGLRGLLAAALQLAERTM